MLLSGLLLVFGSLTGLGASATPGNANSHGASQGCGAYCPSGVGLPSGNGNGNGNANGKPCAGCVGNADSKNPPGQYKDGSDHNNGYECDGNHGIGRTNPAHSGCRTTTTAPHSTTTVSCEIEHHGADVKDFTHNNGDECGTTTTKPPVPTTVAPHATTTTVHVTTTTTAPKTTTTTAPHVTTTTALKVTTTTVNTAGGGTTTTTEPATTTTTEPETTTTTAPAGTTTTTEPATTTSTVGVNVLGENFQRPSAQVGSSSQPLARTGAGVGTELFWSGVALTLGGLAALFGRRRPEEAID